MAEFKNFIIEEWPQIIEYALYFIAYFLIFLYRAKVKKSSGDMRVVVKENTSCVKKLDEELRSTFTAAINIAEEKYMQAKKEYERVINKITNLEKAVRVIIEGTEDIEDAELYIDEEN